MLTSPRNRASALVALTVIATALGVVAEGRATAPAVGPLPLGPVAQVTVSQGSLLSVPLPASKRGYVWRLARRIDPAVAVETSEGMIGHNVVIVFQTVGPGRTTIAFGLTRGSRPKAVRAVRYKVTVIKRSEARGNRR
jgi:hypothetical protein